MFDFDTAIDKIEKVKTPREILSIVNKTNANDRDAVRDYANIIIGLANKMLSDDLKAMGRAKC